MDAKLKADWVKALRSGEFKQASYALNNSGRFCCLGVLAQIQGAEWTASDIVPTLHYPVLNGKPASRNHEDRLSDDAAAGLTFQEQCLLSNMNDEGDTFAQIADYIEQKL